MRQLKLSNDESWLQLGNDASSSQSGHSTASHDAGRAPTRRHYIYLNWKNEIRFGIRDLYYYVKIHYLIFKMEISLIYYFKSRHQAIKHVRQWLFLSLIYEYVQRTVYSRDGNFTKFRVFVFRVFILTYHRVCIIVF